MWVQVGEVEDDALVGWEELRDGKVEEVGETRDQFAVTAYEGCCAAVFDLKGEGFRRGGVGHVCSLEEPILPLRMGKRFELRSNGPHLRIEIWAPGLRRVSQMWATRPWLDLCMGHLSPNDKVHGKLFSELIGPKRGLNRE
jgi:hypothetical protein